jgi:hypothetical protein
MYEIRIELLPYILVDDEYSEYLSKREEYLSAKYPGSSDALLKYTNEHSKLLLTGIMLAESIQTVGFLQEALDTISEIIASPLNCKECTLKSSGCTPENLKLCSLEKAILSINRAQALFFRLFRELSTVEGIIDVSLDKNFFIGYSDSIYENFFIHWAQQSMQKELHNINRSIKHKLSGLLELLNSEFDTVAEKLLFFERQIKLYKSDNPDN